MLIGTIIAGLLLLFGAEVFLSLLIGSFPIVLQQMGSNLTAIPHALVGNLWSYTFLCVPFFIFTGTLLTRTGISKVLSTAVDAWVGHLPGGLGIVTVITCMIFAALNGSSPATAVAVGSVMIQPMADLGYDKKFAAGLCVAGGTLGILIPPSIPMIIYCEITEQPIIDAFTAGIVPGILLGLALIASATFFSWRNHWGMHPPTAWSNRWRATIRAVPILLLPVVVLGGIYGGIFTPTEASAISAVYAILLSGVIYRTLTAKTMWESLQETGRVTSMVWLILAAALLMTKMLTAGGLARMLIDQIVKANLSPVAFLGIVSIIYLALGMVMDTIAILVMTVPIIFPVVLAVGVDPIHFAVLLVILIEIGLITPPFAMNIFVIAGAAKMPFGDVARGVIYLYPAMFAMLLLIIFVPDISLFLGRLIL